MESLVSPSVLVLFFVFLFGCFVGSIVPSVWASLRPTRVQYAALWHGMMRIATKCHWALPGFECDCAGVSWRILGLEAIEHWDGGEYGRKLYFHQHLLWDWSEELDG